MSSTDVAVRNFLRLTAVRSSIVRFPYSLDKPPSYGSGLSAGMDWFVSIDLAPFVSS